MKNNQKENNFVSAVIYLHNCESVVETFLMTVYQQLEDNFKNYEIIFVDDNCTDATLQKVENMTVVIGNAELSIIHMGSHQGVEHAMMAGVDQAIGDYVFEFDSPYIDYDPKLILSVYYSALQGVDVVNAAPSGNQNKSSKLFYSIFNRYSSTPYNLQTERFRLISRRVINRIHDMNSMIIYRKVAYVTSGLKNKTVLYTVTVPHNSAMDRDKRRLRSNLAVDSIVLFTDFAYKFSFSFSILMVAFALFSAIYTLIVFLIGKPVTGWTTTMLFLSAAFFGVFVILTFLIKYISISVRLQMRNKEYSFESVEKVRGT